MKISLNDLIKAYEKIVPLSLSMDFDANGLKIGSKTKKIAKVMACLEVTDSVIDEAIAQQVDVLFVHHDPMFMPLKYIRYDDPHTALVVKLITHDIALYVSHTNLDIVEHGLNDYMFKKLGGGKSKHLEANSAIGRYGLLSKAQTLATFIESYVTPLTKEYRVSVSDLNRKIEKIALVNGSGASYIKLAASKKVDVFITGDVDYHQVMLAREFDLPVIDIGHASEACVKDVFFMILTKIKEVNDFDFEIITSNIDFNPWKHSVYNG